MARRFFFGLALALLSCVGCTFLNEPKALPTLDGGLDASADAPLDVPTDVPDGGPDAADGGMPPGGEYCDDGQDNDGDGTTDCEDFDCLSAPECCDETAGETLVEPEWPENLRDFWEPIPSSLAPPFPTPVSTPGPGAELAGFGETEPTAMVYKLCTELAQGVKIVARMKPRGEADDYVALVLSPVDDMLSGAHLLDDLRVVLYGDGRLSVHSGRALCDDSDTQCIEDSLLRSWSELADQGQVLTVEIQITPGVSPSGAPALLATVAARPNGVVGPIDPFVNRRFFVEQQNLEDSSVRCDRVPGLFLALEGRGSGVSVLPVEVAAQSCANPNVFGSPLDGVLTLPDLSLGTWAAGGFSSIALSSTCASDTCSFVRWDMVVDATNVDMGLEPQTHVGYAIGQTKQSLDWGAGWMAGPSPKTGDDPPTCLSDPLPCEGNLSVRDPSVLMRTNSMGMPTGTDAMLVAYAREELGLSGERDRFALRFKGDVPQAETVSFDADLGNRFLAPEAVTSEMGGPCDSLRDPELVPIEDNLLAYWVLFTCERAGAPRNILVGRLDGAGFSAIRPALPPLSLGAYAEGGVRNPEAIVDFDDGGDAQSIRVWFLARDRRGVESVALANGTVDPGSPQEFPTLAPYPANPVLRSTDRHVSCGVGCDLMSFDVVRRPESTLSSTLRFVFARRRQDGLGLHHEIVPLEQVWNVRP